MEADVSEDSRLSPSGIRIRIKASKTDPFRQGCYVHIGLGKAPLCAVHSMLSYLALRGDKPGPLCLLRSGQPMSRATLTKWLREILSSAGISGNFTSHSLRIGAATVTARNGVPDHLTGLPAVYTNPVRSLGPAFQLSGIVQPLPFIVHLVLLHSQAEGHLVGENHCESMSTSVPSAASQFS